MSTDPDLRTQSHSGPTFDAEIIDGYRRAQAVADGVLVAVDPAVSGEAGIGVPVALTAAAWADCVAWSVDDNARKNTVQDKDGRLWDVLWMTRAAVRSTQARTDRVVVRLYRVPRDGADIEPRLVTLVAVCGPGDNAEPVITIMQPGED